jgi:membrane protein
VAEASRTPPPEAEPAAPSALGRRSLLHALVNAANGVRRDKLGTWAAALTYYSVLSLLPGIMVLTALVGLLDARLSGQLLSQVLPLMPGAVREIVTAAFHDVQRNYGMAGTAAVVGFVLAIWSASGYVNAFIMASNVIYEVPERRPLWERLPIRIAVTLANSVLLVLSILIVVLTGRLTQALGDVIGLPGAARTAWSIVRFPLLLVLIGLLLALLYWASPNARQGGFRWVTPGGFVAVVLWVIVSGGFAFYAANFARNLAVYGELGTVIVFLIWLWLTNLAILIGAELDAELERQRAIAAGQPAAREPYLPLRHDRKAGEDRGFPRSGRG